MTDNKFSYSSKNNNKHQNITLIVHQHHKMIKWYALVVKMCNRNNETKYHVNVIFHF